MLSMDDIKYIKRLHEKEGLSIREIMRRTGYHYETVRKYLDMEDFNEPLYPPRKTISLLEPLKPVIDSWLQEDLKHRVSNATLQNVSLSDYRKNIRNFLK